MTHAPQLVAAKELFDAITKMEPSFAEARHPSPCIEPLPNKHAGRRRPFGSGCNACWSASILRSSYGSDGCICGTNMEYEDDVIHSHYREDQEEYDEGNAYYAPYFQNIGKPMPRSKGGCCAKQIYGYSAKTATIVDQRALQPLTYGSEYQMYSFFA